MPIDDLLQQGITAAQAGNLAEARRLLYQVVRANPRSELGWQWLGYSIEVPEKQAECFRRVLLINPKNTYARQQLEALKAQGITPAAPTGRRSAARGKKRPNPLLLGGIALAAVLCIAVIGAGVFLINRGLWQSGGIAAPIPVSPEAIPTLPPPPTPVPTPNYAPIYGEEPCAFEIPEGVNVKCGALVVPENRAGDPKKTIRLAVAIFNSTNPNPAPDPILFLQGGPGAPAIQSTVDAYETIVLPFLSERDFIVFDPRGTGYTKPALDCDELRTTDLLDLQGKIPESQRQAYYGGALQTCRRTLGNAGIDLNAYTSAAYAADVRDLLTALGYKQANLYGVSYGTRVAQIVLRDYPQVVRSVILDSVVPLESKVLEKLSENQQSALNALFAACAADPACASTYPNLQDMYQSVVQTLDATPLRTTTGSIPEEGTLNVLINGRVFTETIVWMLRYGETIPAIPLIISRAYAGNYDPLRFMLSMPYDTVSQINLGTYIAVNCHEQVYIATTGSVGLIVNENCALWGAAPLQPSETEPARSGLPVLLISGRFDPATPPTFARQVAANLGHATVLEFPTQGHVPTASTASDCARQAMAEFIRNPNAPVQPTCLAEEQRVAFLLPYTGETPIPLEEQRDETQKLLTKIPQGWTKIDDNVYARQNGFNDVVQISVSQSTFTKERLIDSYAANFNNGAGFDEPAVLQGTEKYNNIEWSLYKAKSGALMIDMAFAKNGKQTMMVILVCFPDEHDGLYRMVFLPVIEATRPLK